MRDRKAASTGRDAAPASVPVRKKMDCLDADGITLRSLGSEMAVDIVSKTLARWKERLLEGQPKWSYSECRISDL